MKSAYYSMIFLSFNFFLCGTPESDLLALLYEKNDISMRCNAEDDISKAWDLLMKLHKDTEKGEYRKNIEMLIKLNANFEGYLANLKPIPGDELRIRIYTTAIRIELKILEIHGTANKDFLIQKNAETGARIIMQSILSSKTLSEYLKQENVSEEDLDKFVKKCQEDTKNSASFNRKMAKGLKFIIKTFSEDDEFIIPASQASSSSSNPTSSSDTNLS